MEAFIYHSNFLGKECRERRRLCSNTCGASRNTCRPEWSAPPFNCSVDVAAPKSEAANPSRSISQPRREAPDQVRTKVGEKEVVLKDWKWRGWNICYAMSSDNPMDNKASGTVVLIHGFGGNCMHFRRNIPGLGKRNYSVYSLDLIGFGLSDKPPVGAQDRAGGFVTYNFDYWSAEVRDFITEIASANRQPVALVANSIGCMVAMQVAVENPHMVDALVIISPSLRLLNVRKRGWIQNLMAPLLMRILRYRPIGAYFLNQLAQPEALRRILLKAYAVKEAVDDELVSLLREPALTAGALDVFLAFITYDEGPIPEDFLPQLGVSTMMIHGEMDEFEPYELAREYRHYSTVKKFVPLPGVGHCAMDEVPGIVDKLIDEFLQHKLDHDAFPNGSLLVDSSGV